MKRTVSVACALVLLLGLWVSGALANTYDIQNNTLVSRSDNTTVFQNARTNPIQDSSAPYFIIYGADWNANAKTLTIFTDWSPTHDGVDGVTTADLFISLGCNSTYDYAIGLDTSRAGKIYDGAITYSSAPSGYIFGYDYNVAGQRVPVLMADYKGTTTTPVWTAGGSGDEYAWSVTVDLSGLGISGPFGFLFAPATCANGPMAACVPIPPSVLLMGSGLLGLGLVGWRRRGSEDQIG